MPVSLKKVKRCRKKRISSKTPFQRCDQIIDGLLRIYCRGKRDCVSKIARNITLESYEHNKKLAVYMREISPAEKIHANLDSVDRMACDVRADLLSKVRGKTKSSSKVFRCSQLALRILHKMLETEILRNLRKAQTPDYYTEIYYICTVLRPTNSFFHIMPEYLKTRTAAVTKDSVLGLENVPEVNSLCDRMDPYVRLELLPTCIYPPHCFSVQKTRTLTQCEDLKWNQDFQFLVPQELFYTHGSSLCISVLDHDRFVSVVH
ncbi:C2 domain protein [Cooperia oncophora]